MTHIKKCPSALTVFRRVAMYVPAASLLLLVSAADGLRSSPWSNVTWHPTPTSADILDITVGAAGRLIFSPESANAPVGSTLRFNFLGLNHTLTQSTLRHPCKADGGFDTGFRQFNPLNVSGRFVVDFRVRHREAQYFFCAQTGPQRSHCQAGMVFSLNANAMENQLFEEGASGASGVIGSAVGGSCPLTARPTSSISGTQLAQPTAPPGTAPSGSGTTGTTYRRPQPPTSTSIFPPIASNRAPELAVPVAAWIAMLTALLCM